MTRLCPKLPLYKIGGVVLDTHFYGIAASKFNRKSIKQSSLVYSKQNLIFQGNLRDEN